MYIGLYISQGLKFYLKLNFIKIFQFQLIQLASKLIVQKSTENNEQLKRKVLKSTRILDTVKSLIHNSEQQVK